MFLPEFLVQTPGPTGPANDNRDAFEAAIINFSMLEITFFIKVATFKHHFLLS